MVIIILILVVLAGIGLCLAAWSRWRSLARPDSATEGRCPVTVPGTGLGWLWLAFALLTAATVLALFGGGSGGDHRDLAYGVLTVWAATASMVFLGRWLAMPSRSLLALPVGAMALMVATASATGPARIAAAPSMSGEGLPWIVMVHIAFMVGFTVAMILAGTAGLLYLFVSLLLKRASPSVMNLPNLRLLERLSERGLIVGTALLTGGIAVGGVALRGSEVSLANPTSLLGLGCLLLLVVILALRAANRLGGRHGQAWAAVIGLAATALCVLSQMVLAHG
jgi:hypothetical protein